MNTQTETMIETLAEAVKYYQDKDAGYASYLEGLVIVCKIKPMKATTYRAIREMYERDFEDDFAKAEHDITIKLNQIL